VQELSNLVFSPIYSKKGPLRKLVEPTLVKAGGTEQANLSILWWRQIFNTFFFEMKIDF
jgi:hypothetical protein